MLLAVLSDIHGNLAALEAVLADLTRIPVNGYIAAGDYVGCPFADETLDRLRSLNPWIIKGNSDINLLRYAAGQAPPDWGTSQQFALNRWVYRNIIRQNLEYLEGLPEQQRVEIPGTAPIRVVHGSPRDPFEEIFPDRDPLMLDLALRQVPELTLVCGHTHLSWQRRQNGKLALNPGAVSGALNGDPRAQYALLCWKAGSWQVEHRAVTYDLARLRLDFEVSGLLEEGGALAKAFLLSNETGRNVGKSFLKYAYRLAAEAGHAGCEVVPDDIWERAAETFDWGL